MNAIPATALGEAGSSNRSSQPDSADGEGVARSRSRRQRLFSDRRSARESKSFSIARRIAESCCRAPTVRCLPRSRRRTDSGKSPPEPSGCRASPGRRPPEHAAGSPRRGPQALIRSRYKGSPASDVNPWLDENWPHTGNRAAPVPASRTPLVMVLELQTKTISLIFRANAQLSPHFFEGPKCNLRLTLRCDDFRMTKFRSASSGFELSRMGSCHAQCGTLGPSFRPAKGQKTSKSRRSRNEGIPEGANGELEFS